MIVKNIVSAYFDVYLNTVLLGKRFSEGGILFDDIFAI